MQLPKYAIFENERRFLVRPEVAETLAVSAPRLICDRYLSHGRLRLRKVTDEAGGRTEYKLCKKYGSSDPICEPIVNIYLTADEYAAFAILPGADLAKQRLSVEHAGRAFSLDLFSGPLQGLAICEAEAPSREAALEIRFPPWARVEVTADPAFSGAALAAGDPRAVRRRAAELLVAQHR